MTDGSTKAGFNIKGLILDYGEVLCRRPTEAQIRRMADVFGISPERFATLYEKNRRPYDRGDLTAERYWFSFADEPGVSLRTDQVPLLRDWDVEMWSNTTPVMLQWLEATHASGLRTALLSNMHADIGNYASGNSLYRRSTCKREGRAKSRHQGHSIRICSTTPNRT